MSIVRLINSVSAHNFLSYIGTRIISLGIFAFSVSFFIGAYGEESYGIAALIMMMLGYAQIIDLGAGYALTIRITRAKVRGGARCEALVQRAVPVYLFIAAIGIGGFFLASDAISALIFGTVDYKNLVQWLGACCGVILMSSCCTAVLQAFNKVYLINYSRTVLEIFKSAALIFTAYFELDFSALAWLIFLGTIIKLGLDAFLVSLVFGGWRWTRPDFRLKDALLNFKYGWALGLTTMLGLVVSTVERVYIFRGISPTALAHYTVAFDIFSKAYFLLFAINATTYTLLIDDRFKRDSSAALLRTAYYSLVTVFLLYFLPVTLFGELLVTLWIGAEFAKETSLMLAILLPNTVFYLLLTILYNYWQAQVRPDKILSANVAGFVVFFFVFFTLSRDNLVLTVTLSNLAMVLCQVLLLLPYNNKSASRGSKL